MKIRVVHLSTSSEGGAGLAARRLNQALNAVDFESIFLSLSSKNYLAGEDELTVARSLYQRIISFIYVRFQRNFSTKVDFSPLSKSVINVSDIKIKYPPESTILHIHNWFNMLSLKSIAKFHDLGYKIVFTIHDERLFTGGCHYSLDCSKFTTECKKCPLVNSKYNKIIQNSFNKLKYSISRLGDEIVVIAPSMWIKERAKSSTILKNIRIVHIPNSLGNFGNDYVIKPKMKLKEKIVLGIASYDPKSYLKYGDLISTFTQKSAFNKVYNLIFLRDFMDPALFWNEIDFLLVLSRIDNSPNVIHEAKKFNIPIVATSVGGISELLIPEYDLILEQNDLSVEMLIAMKDEMIKRLNDKSLILKSKNKFETHINTVIIDHINLYSELLKLKTK